MSLKTIACSESINSTHFKGTMSVEMYLQPERINLDALLICRHKKTKIFCMLSKLSLITFMT